jgi:Domain of unknown function (DUF4249)
MKIYYKILIISFLNISALTSCEDVVSVDTPNNEQKLVIDAQLNDGVGPQKIKVMVSQAYFDNTAPIPATGAVVKVTDNEGNKFEFIQKKSNDIPTIYFEWLPKAGEKFGKIGNTYTLEVDFKGENYKASTLMARVPKIDSLVFAFKDNSALPGGDANTVKKGYRPEFFARDPIGLNDCYFLKGVSYNKKDNKWNQDSELAVYDAAFQPGARADGLVFILPVRRSIAPKLLSEGDSIRVELYSISPAHYDFLRSAAQDAGNQGLFATPPANFPSNLINSNSKSTKKALGWFSASGLSKMQVVIDPKKATPNTD